MFHAVAGHVEVKTQDYNLVLSLDPRAMWLKACIIISRYISTMAEKFPSGFSPTSQSFGGRKITAIAQKIKPSVVKELTEDIQTARVLEGAVKKLISHYKVADPQQDKVMSARVHMFSNIGKLALKVASALEQANVKAMSLSKNTISPEKRREIASMALKNQFHEVEAKYRSSLVIAAGCSDLDMPELVYPKAKGSSCILLNFFDLLGLQWLTYYLKNVLEPCSFVSPKYEAASHRDPIHSGFCKIRVHIVVRILNQLHA